MNVLDRILADKRRQLKSQKETLPRRELEKRFTGGPRRSLRTTLRSSARPRIIAELKKASPSRGVLRPDFDVISLAGAYSAGGAVALSVLTDAAYFQGSLAFLEQARQAAPLPVLRKDFIIDEYQVVESACAGADAILLIVSILSRAQLERLAKAASDYALEALVEVHSLSDAETALASGSTLIGVNNRDLRTFDVTLETSRTISEKYIRGGAVTWVSESGIASPEDIALVQSWGYDAFLIGEAFMTQPDPGVALRRLIAGSATSISAVEKS